MAPIIAGMPTSGVTASIIDVKNQVDVIHGPEDRAHCGMREVALKDRDGYLLVFAQDLAAE